MEITEQKVIKHNNNLVADSAGLIGVSHLGIPHEMQGAMIELGYAPAPIHQKKATKLLEEQDYMLCMQESYRIHILNIAPGMDGKVHSFTEFAGFPDKKIVDSSKLIRDPDIDVLKMLPRYARTIAYRLLGYVNPEDENAVRKLHLDIVKEIQTCVSGVLKKTYNI